LLLLLLLLLLLQIGMPISLARLHSATQSLNPKRRKTLLAQNSLAREWRKQTVLCRFLDYFNAKVFPY
jgi:hypothetical protein